MQIYDFDKNRKDIISELKNKLIVRENELKKIRIFYNINNRSDNYKEVYDNKNLFELDKIDYSFSQLKNIVIGAVNLNSNKLYKDICNKNIDYSEFVNCKFNNVRFENCTFFGSKFENCSFNNVYFDNCNFEEDYKAGSLFQNNCIFDKCTFYKSNIKNAILKSNNLHNVKFIFSNLRNSIFSECIISSVIFTDCDLKSVKIIKTNIEIMKFEDENTSKVDENTFIDILKLNKKTKNSYEDGYKVYKNISALFERNRLFSHAGEYYYLAKCAERKSLKGFERIKSNIFYCLCGYGERPTYALITSLETVLIFSFIYMFCGVSVNDRIINYGFNMIYYLSRELIYIDFINCFYFSLVTFTTVGYGDIFPIGYSVIFSCIEMILGVTMMGIWTATLARKITR